MEVWAPRGLITFHLLFVLELKTRRVHFAGSTVHPHTDWMKQVARDITAWDYHKERNHQGLENQLIDPGDVAATTETNPTLPIKCRERLGGMLRYYHRAA